ncbi:MAG: hypothetical protein U0931_37285 [Vulcanimicrobiota bacterium]
MSLLELMVAVGLLLLLTAALFESWMLASRSWVMVFRNSSRLGSLEIALRQVQEHLQDSAAQAAIYQNTPNIPALAFQAASGLTSLAQNQQFHYQAGQAIPLWQKYGVYYLNTAAGSLEYRELAIPSGDPASTTRLPLTSWNGPQGVRILDDYCLAGKAVASPVDSLRWERTQSLLTVTLGSPGAPRGPGSGRVTLTQTIFLHN